MRNNGLRDVFHKKRKLGKGREIFWNNAQIQDVRIREGGKCPKTGAQLYMAEMICSPWGKGKFYVRTKHDLTLEDIKKQLKIIST